MTCRHITQQEVFTLFNKSTLPKDIEDGLVIGVAEVCSTSMVIEECKIEGFHDEVLKKNYFNLTNEIEKGSVWVLELTSENIARLLLDHSFYECYCDKKGNPLKLSQRITLYHDNDYSYWTENVYIEAFDE